jgi:hypothetical protein
MAGMLQMRRSRGAFSGFLLILLGLWGALIPFIGPYFHFAYTPDTSWTYTTARLWLEILPGAAVFLGGFFLMIATGRHTALFGAILAAAAGAWFTLGTMLSPLWNNHVTLGGSPAGTTVYMRIMEQIGFFSALGVVVVFIAAAAFGRIMSVPAGIRTVEPVTEPVREPVSDPVSDPVNDRVPAGTVPTRTDAAATVPAEALPTRTVPARTVATDADAAPTEMVPVRKVREEDTQTIG